MIKKDQEFINKNLIGSELFAFNVIKILSIVQKNLK